MLLQVSFYRGEIPSNLPEEVAQKRKGLDNQWLATLPLKLPVSSNPSFFFIFLLHIASFSILTCEIYVRFLHIS